MRKNFKGYIIGFVAGAISMVGTQIFAEDGLQKIEAYLRPNLPVTLNGSPVKLDNPPVMVDGSTYLKLRDVSKLTGVQVNWNDQAQTVELTNNNILTNDSAINNQPITDLSQIIPLLNKEHDTGFDRSTLTLAWKMTDEEYNAYSNISDKFIRRSFCIRIYQYGMGKSVLPNWTSKEEELVKMNIVHNSKIIAVFRDKPISDENSFIEYN